MKIIAKIYAYFNPVWYNELLAAEYRRRLPDVLVKYGFEVASIISLAANEIEKAQTKTERLNIERNMKQLIQETKK